MWMRRNKKRNGEIEELKFGGIATFYIFHLFRLISVTDLVFLLKSPG